LFYFLCVLENYLFSVFSFFALAHGIRTIPFFSTLQKDQYGYPWYAAKCAAVSCFNDKSFFWRPQSNFSVISVVPCFLLFFKKLLSSPSLCLQLCFDFPLPLCYFRKKRRCKTVPGWFQRLHIAEGITDAHTCH